MTLIEYEKLIQQLITINSGKYSQILLTICKLLIKDSRLHPSFILAMEKEEYEQFALIVKKRHPNHRYDDILSIVISLKENDLTMLEIIKNI